MKLRMETPGQALLARGPLLRGRRVRLRPALVLPGLPGRSGGTELGGVHCNLHGRQGLLLPLQERQRKHVRNVRLGHATAGMCAQGAV